MKVRVFLFGVIADICGKFELELENISSTDLLINYLIQKYPEIEKETYRIAVNQKMINQNSNLADGDEIALLPPFAGG